MLARRLILDRVSGKLMWALTVLSCLLVFAMLGGLYLRSRPLLELGPLNDLLLGLRWRPSQGEFGFAAHRQVDLRQVIQGGQG